MKTLNTMIGSLVVDEEDVKIVGEFRGVAEVHPDRLLWIDGLAQGSITVEPGGRLYIDGASTARIEAAEDSVITLSGGIGGEIDLDLYAVLTMSGVITADLPMDGTVLVAPGSMIDQMWVLTSDGMLEEADPEGPLDLATDVGDFLQYVDGEFKPSKDQ